MNYIMVRLPQGFPPVTGLPQRFPVPEPKGFPASGRTVSVLSDAHQRVCVVVNETKVSHL